MEIPNYNITIGNATDIGKVRDHNEDYMAHFDTPLGYCIVVCDGMGGHAAGDVASQNAVDAIKHFLQNGKITKLDVPSSLQNAIGFANFKLREMVQQNNALKGMGTTCVIALINKTELFLAHVGDSRIYLIRGKEIKQITKDHSVVQNLIDAGALTEKEAEQSDKRNQITKAIGIFEKIEPTVTNTPIKLLNNDKILLCCDGLTVHVSNEKIAETILSEKDIQTAVLKLISLANEGGGSDNITIQLVHYTDSEPQKEKDKDKDKKKKFSVKLIIALVIFLLGLLCLGFWFLKSSGKNKSAKTINSNSSLKNNDSISNSNTDLNNVQEENNTTAKTGDEKGSSKDQKNKNDSGKIRNDNSTTSIPKISPTNSLSSNIDKSIQLDTKKDKQITQKTKKNH